MQPMVARMANPKSTTKSGGKWLSRSECAERLGVAPDSWDRMWTEYPDLVRAVRTVRVNPKGRGVRRWDEEAFEAWRSSGACR